MTSEPSYLPYLQSLESRISEQTNDLETRHMEAAINAQVGDDAQAADPDVVPNVLSPFMPATAEQIGTFCDYLCRRRQSQEEESDQNRQDATSTAPLVDLLDLGSGDGRVCVAAARLGLVRDAIGLDVSPMCVRASRVLAHQEGVFGAPAPEDAPPSPPAEARGRCEFHEIDLTVPPNLLLDNPHMLADRMRRANVVFLYTYPTLLVKLIPLLAKLTEVNIDDGAANGDGMNERPVSKKVEIVTLFYHISNEYTVAGHVRDVSGTQLRIYDRITAGCSQEDNLMSSSLLPPPPEPKDDDEFDKEFARSSIKFAMPWKQN